MSQIDAKYLFLAERYHHILVRKTQEEDSSTTRFQRLSRRSDNVVYY